MSELISLIFAAALVNNLVLVQLLGVSSFFLGSQKLSATFELALYTTVVIVIGSSVNQIITTYLLEPLNLNFLRLITYLSVSTALSCLLATLMRENLPLSYRQQPLMFYFAGANSAVIGLSLVNSTSSLTFLESFFISIGAAIGFSMVLIAFSALRIRLSFSQPPGAFRGAPLLLITAGIAAMSFLGFAGLV